MADLTNGLDFIPGMQLDQPEMTWWQAEFHRYLRELAVGFAGSHEYGWPYRVDANGSPNMGWVIQDDNSGQLRIRSQSDFATNGPQAPWHGVDRRPPGVPYVAVDQLGRLIPIPLGQDVAVVDDTGARITVPDDGVWYTLIAKYNDSKREPGTLNLTGGSTSVTGTGTKFTRYTDNTDAIATLLRIDASDTTAGNEGSYRIATITDDENLVLASPAPATETGCKFRVQGDFLTGTPADPDTHLNREVVFELVARTVTPPTDGLICYDVMFDSGTDPDVQRIDRRLAQALRNRHDMDRIGGFALLSRSVFEPGVGDGPANALSVAATDRVDFVAAAPRLGGSANDAGLEIGGPVGRSSTLIIMAQDDGASGHDLTCKEYLPYGHQPIYGPDQASVRVDFATGLSLIQGLCVAAVPVNTGTTHIVFIANSNGTLQSYATADGGLNWSGPTTILNPAGSNEVRYPQCVLTRLGRLIVVFEYDDVDGTGDKQIRYVYSDDYGDSWNLGSGGYEIMAEGSQDLERPTIVEDDDGRLWTAWKRTGYEIRMVVGQDFNDPTPAGLGGEQPADGFIICRPTTQFYDRTSFPALVVGNARLFCGLGGTIGCIHQDGTHLYLSTVANGRIMEVRQLTTTVSTGGSIMDHAVCLGAAGRLDHFVVDDDTSPDRCLLMRYDLVPTGRPLHRLGGT